MSQWLLSGFHYAALAIALILHIIDWRQTVFIARHPYTYHELNWVLGRKPNPNQVHSYFAFTAIALSSISLESRFWYVVLGLWVATETWAVIHNRRLGIPL
jgi:hypothetical protein